MIREYINRITPQSRWYESLRSINATSGPASTNTPGMLCLLKQSREPMCLCPTFVLDGEKQKIVVARSARPGRQGRLPY
jgi:hypothetical protein